jgi:hypothetical protein
MAEGEATVGRLLTYAAALAAEWLGGRLGRDLQLHQVRDGAVPVYVAAEGDGAIALAVATLWEPETDTAADDARQMMEERLSGGLVRGPHVLWVPPAAAVPSREPDASDFVQRVQQAAGPLPAGGRGEVMLPVQLQLGKIRDEGGYASVTGALSRWWTLITERVDGTFYVNANRMRRAPQSSQAREELFDKIGQMSQALQTGQALEFETDEAWTVQRLTYEPLGQTGFAIAQAPPRIDPTDGSIMRRLVRKRLKDASGALAGVDAPVKGVVLIAIYDYAEHENLGAFVRSLDPSLYAQLQLVAALVDGEVRPIFQPRTAGAGG